MRDGHGNTAFRRYLTRDIPSLFVPLGKLGDASSTDIQPGPANRSSCSRHFALNRLDSLLFRRGLGRPFNWRVLQAAFDQLASKAVSVVADRAPCHKLMVVNSICFDLRCFRKKTSSVRRAYVRHSWPIPQLKITLAIMCFVRPSRVQRGGLSSPASQPGASVFKGSMEKLVFSMRWQVLHSKVRSS